MTGIWQLRPKIRLGLLVCKVTFPPMHLRLALLLIVMEAISTTFGVVVHVITLYNLPRFEVYHNQSSTHLALFPCRASLHRF